MNRMARWRGDLGTSRKTCSIPCKNPEDMLPNLSHFQDHANSTDHKHNNSGIIRTKLVTDFNERDTFHPTPLVLNPQQYWYMSKVSLVQGSLFWLQSTFLSKWECFPPEIHQPELIPPSLCSQKREPWSGTHPILVETSWFMHLWAGMQANT
jgi:hypothetical protein